MGIDAHGGDVYGHPGVRLDFSVNTNPFGLPEAVRHALISRVDEYAGYPDPQCRALRAAIALHENVAEDTVLCGNGAADLIYRLCYALRPRNALVCAPAFSEYEGALTQAGCRVSHHMLKAEAGFALGAEIEARLRPDTDLLFLCHPNNPTGRLIDGDLLEHILVRARDMGCAVVVDECFLDFTSGPSAKRRLYDIPGLAVLKAFTKMYAVAGLRLGYMLCADKALLRKTAEAAQCWSVSVPAQIAGVAALSCADWPEKTRRFIGGERPFLSEALSALGIEVFPSDANFLLLRSVRPLYEPLLQKGILIRPCANFKGLDETYFRVGIKTHAENLRLVKALKELLV